MTLTPVPIYPDWKAPAEDGQILLWPHPQELIAQTERNHQRLSTSQSRVQNRPLSELRRAMRSWIGHASDEQPLIATGHQTELYHTGVWVKNVLIDTVATKLNGAAYHVSVDTDEPKHLQLRWLGGGAPVTDDPNLSGAAWSGLLDAPSPAHIQTMEQAFGRDAKNWDFEPLMPEFLRSLRRLALETPDLPHAVTSAAHEIEWGLGLRHHSLLASPIWMSEPFLAFVHHILSRPNEFAQTYNAALADFRSDNKVKSATRPMPDLAMSADACEAPFWLDRVDVGQRQRAQVRRISGQWVLKVDETREFVLNPSDEDAPTALLRWLRENQLRLSPRAIPLTMFLRLFIADQFVHGIGGGRYDQVTDRIIARFFGIEPPAFSVTTATLYFPMSVHRQRACLPCVVQQGHQLKHSLLGDEKKDWIASISAAPRQSQERYALFQRMHQRLSAVSANSGLLNEWRQTLEKTIQQAMDDKVLFDRELFFAVQSRERLQSMISPYRELFDDL
jgi:hypothetical protein